MNQLLNQLQNNDWTLLVSLPRNDEALARAALRGGAQGLKVHINVEHFASGTKFGSFEEEAENLEKIVAVAREYSASVGVVPGGTPFATPAEFAKLAALGVDYFDAYPAEAPAWTLSQTDLDIMLAAWHGATSDELMALEELGMTLCEASIMHHDAYGQPLSTLDLAHYHDLAQTIAAPFIVPSQKKLLPSDQALLQRVGARGVLIGAIVTGRDATTIEAATRSFKDAMA
jgi:hypothetical protein